MSPDRAGNKDVVSQAPRDVVRGTQERPAARGHGGRVIATAPKRSNGPGVQTGANPSTKGLLVANPQPKSRIANARSFSSIASAEIDGAQNESQDRARID
jgi:hypothetical protein